MIIAPSRAAFLKGYGAPGAFIAASATLAEKPLEEVLDAGRQRFKERGKCTLTTASTAFRRGGYAGIFDLWDGCGGTTSRFLTIAAKKTDGSHTVYIQFQTPVPADLAILDRMLVTVEFAP